MESGTRAINCRFHLEAFLRGTAKLPRERVWICFSVSQLTEFVALSIVPEHSFAKDQPQGQVVN
jgi:hypothetical protein